METNSKKRNYSRRNFLETGASAVAGVTLGLAIGNALTKHSEEQPEMVKMLTADGKLVEIDKRLIPKMCGNPTPVSNQALREWMEEGKQ